MFLILDVEVVLIYQFGKWGYKGQWLFINWLETISFTTAVVFVVLNGGLWEKLALLIFLDIFFSFLSISLRLSLAVNTY